ncbi:unnamed protein product [Toxocara canis]|uniref:rRNA-processing protein EBP2 homolog n=1 Tax=Toxocara canis TaxID=6265 RepID=A0A183UPL3_TOXCA|nr:unnamed protein product [Toxocara canis]
MVKKSNRRAKKRRLMSDPFNDLNEEDMVSDEGSDKGIKEEGDEEKPYLTLNGMHSDSEESDAAQDSDREQDPGDPVDTPICVVSNSVYIAEVFECVQYTFYVSLHNVDVVTPLKLQVALKEGLLKTDRLNYVVRKKRPIINKVAELRAKLAKFEKKLPWLETLDVTVANDSMTSEAVDDDFEREIIFYKQAQEAVQTAVPRLLKMGVKVFRPADYYAEMAKSDEHMQKIRKRMLDMQESKQRQDAIRRLREEKKFAAKVQKEVLENRQAEKKKLLEAVKKHRKGMKSQLEDMLNNAKRLQRDEEEEENEMKREREAKRRNRQEGRGSLKMRLGKRMGRAARDKKYGFGGQKKRSKQNDKQSFSELAFPGVMRPKRVGSKVRSGRTRFRGGKRR